MPIYLYQFCKYLNANFFTIVFILNLEMMHQKLFTLLFVSLFMAFAFPAGAQTQADEAEWPDEAPFVSPYTIKKSHGARPITALRNVGAVESRYFQLIAGGTKDETSDEGGLALTMVWKKASGTTPAHYELALERLTNTHDVPGKPDSRVRLERTLWEVRAKRYPNSPALYYTLINKASQLPLQISKTDLDDAGYGSPAIVNGSTDWLWADGAEAASSDGSNVDPSIPQVLQNYIRAAIDDTHTIYLVQERNTQDVQIKRQNSNLPAPGNAIRFEAWEANPIVLTAEQINGELGYESVTTQGKGKKDSFRFTFSPDVEGLGARNVMTEYAFQAVSAEGDQAGDGAEGYVRFRAWEGDVLTDKYLMVDTAYHDAEINDAYDLQMAVKTIEYPKYAVLADGGKVTDAYSQIVFSQLKRQTNFKPVFFPSTQSLHLQVETLFKADKRILINHPDPNRPFEVTWWGQMFHSVERETMRFGNTFPYYDLYLPIAGLQFFRSYSTAEAPSYPNLLRWGGNAYYDSPARSVSEHSYDTWFSGKATRFLFADRPFTNVIKLTTLTHSPKHTVLTCGTRDPYDAADPDGYDGLLTHISLEGLMPVYTEVADIDPGFYYMQNAHTIPTDLLKTGEYRYEDLASTAATYAYWNALAETWSVGEANQVKNEGENGTPYSLNGTTYYARTAAEGNLVYAADLKEIPSAQWYIDGNGGYYTITNRESKRTWGTSYWWKLAGSDDTYVNHNAYLNGTGLTGGLERNAHRDTIRLIRVADAVLKDIHGGYLNLSAEEAAADTSVFRIRFHTIGSDDLFVGEENGVLKVMKDNPGGYKLERAWDRTIQMTDAYNGSEHFQDSLVYGLNPTGQPAYQLARAMYYIYKDEVSSSTTEDTGVRTREYVTLNGGKYVLTPVKVTVKDGYTTYDKTLNDGKTDARKSFYIKRISTDDPQQFVWVDPHTVGREMNANGSQPAQGVRVFVNQQTTELQPAGLVSYAASNVYDNSVYTLEPVVVSNYRDIRTPDNDRDTLSFFKASNPSIFLYENSRVAGANVGLLDRVNDAQVQKNYALFVDTANVSRAEKPMFLLAIRPVDTRETSNIPEHNRHLYTTADYLVNLIDSAKAGNPAYRYASAAYAGERPCYRLGFVPAVHKGSSLYIVNNGNEEIALDGDLTKASFAFRYTDTARDRFYIETSYDGTTPGWIRILNEVPVVTGDLQEAEVYQVKKAATAPTANEAIAVRDVVTVESVRGAVIVKNAAGKQVTVHNLLGRPVAGSRLASSDLETIAVPTGTVVVVAVEGSEAVKTVVK